MSAVVKRVNDSISVVEHKWVTIYEHDM